MKDGRRLVIVHGLSVALLMGAGAAQAAMNWAGECRDVNGQRLCILSQTLTNDRGEWLATLRVQPQNAEALLQVIVPTGVHLGSGMAYAVDGGAERLLTYRRCLRDGCEAQRDLSQAEWQEVKRGASMTLVLRPDAGTPPVGLSVSLAGITALEKALAQ